ncbi:MAG: alpha-L-fucosidase [Candidatus Sumerlaeota bacterium]|nr:alpha-L-fucosidase [Candidatus Sumerlaeota bacterium]
MSCSRRRFVKSALGIAGAGCLTPWALSISGAEKNEPANGAHAEIETMPVYLKGYEEAYRKDPRAAAIQWFMDAKFGLFAHYGLMSLSPGGKARPLPSGVTLADLARRFTAEKFDAGALADLAVAARMRYINFTPYHGGGPYMFRSQVAHPTSLELPAKRDLAGELAEACRKRGLGLFLYVHAGITRSNAETLARNHAILREWLTQYGPIAGLWFDTVADYYDHPEYHPKLLETYALIRSLQPQCLISYCHGATGEEDFLATEHSLRPPSQNSHLTAEARRKLETKPAEICTTLQLDQKDGKGTKMWFDVEGAYHRNPEEVWKLLAGARRDKANLLVNTGLRGDGSVHPDDEKTLREIGRRLSRQGFP